MYTVISKPNCGFCVKAKNLLFLKNIDYKELHIEVGQDKDISQSYIALSHAKLLAPSARTVPIILKDNEYIGGYTELVELLTSA